MVQLNGGQGLPTIGQMSIPLQDQIRLKRQAEVFQKTGCIGGCPTGTQLTYQVVLRENHPGASLSCKIRCQMCLTFYEITAAGDVVNVKRVTEESFTPKKTINLLDGKPS